MDNNATCPICKDVCKRFQTLNMSGKSLSYADLRENLIPKRLCFICNKPFDSAPNEKKNISTICVNCHYTRIEKKIFSC